MADLLQGSPQQATSYTTSSTETPKWMQDAIYNQIQMAQQTAAIPYQQYNLPTVAELSPLQQQAQKQVQTAQGQFAPTVAAAQQGLTGLSTVGTAAGLTAAQNPYLAQGNVGSNLSSGQGLWGQAGQLNSVAAANPYLQNAAGTDISGSANPYLNQASQTTAQALSDRALNAANPYLQSAAQSSTQNIDQYMSPYQQNVMDTMAKQGTRNLTENLLPGVSDSFTKAGQFGSNRMGEFGSRALRDTQEAILNQQGQLANQGYGQALTASQTDLARQAQLAGTVGSISGADLSRVLQGGAQYGNLAQTQGQLTAQDAANQLAVGQQYGNLTNQQQQNLGNLGQQYTAAGQAQQQYGLSAAQAAQQAQAGDLARQQSVLGQMADTAKLQQGMSYADTAALDAAGAEQQAQQQAQLTAAKSQFDQANQYPKQQLDWLNTQVRGMQSSVPTQTTASGATSGTTYSPSVLSQLAGAGLAAKGAGLV